MLDFLVGVAVLSVAVLTCLTGFITRDCIGRMLDGKDSNVKGKRSEETQEAVGKTHISQTIEEGPTA